MLWIETDLEPDDILAIVLLPIANYYVLGEGDPVIKSRRMVAYLELLQNLNTCSASLPESPKTEHTCSGSLQESPKTEHTCSDSHIIQGLPSKKKFAEDGKEFDISSERSERRNDEDQKSDISSERSERRNDEDQNSDVFDEQSEEKTQKILDRAERDLKDDNLPPFQEKYVYLDEFKVFAQSDSPIMFSLKPMRELLAEYHKNPDDIAKLVSNVTLYTYGGFNFRSVLYEYEKELPLLLSHFRQVNIYESFYVTGEQNSVNATNMPRFHQWMMDHSTEPFLTTLLKLTKIWNTHLLNEMKGSIKNKKSDDPAKLRQQKVIDSIQNHIDFQYVLADFGLAAIYREIDAIPVKNLRFVNGYTNFDDGDSSIRVYRSVPFGELENLIVNRLDHIF